MGSLCSTATFARLRIEIVALTAGQAYAAAEARRLYGKGRTRPT
jgi:uncharacterized protein with PIN domain